MSYKVRIPRDIKQEIASWGLPRELLLKVYHRLLEVLPTDPDRYLKERIVPLMAFGYTFVLVDNKRMPHHHICRFAVDRFDDEQELHIVGCRHTTEDTGDN